MAVMQVANSDTGKKVIGAGCVLAIGICLLPFFLFMYLLASVFGILSAQAQTCGSSGGGGGTTTGPGGGGGGLSGVQLANARTIIGVAKGMGIGINGQIIAIATAEVESSLTNLPNGDRDSAGLFQQRPSQGWGTYAQVTNPVYAATIFLSRMTQVPNWQGATDPTAMGAVAQKVQGSAFPAKYATQISSSTGNGPSATSIVNGNQDAPSVAPDPAANKPGSGGGGGGTGQSCPNAGVDGYINPVADPAWGTLRTDQGIDYNPTVPLPVLAIGAGTITYSDIGHSGWPGPGGCLCTGGFIKYQLSAGPKKGLCIYVAENIINLLPVGTVVTAGEQIALASPPNTDSWTEWGWASCGGGSSPAVRGGGQNATAPSGGQAFTRFLIELGARTLYKPGPGPDIP